MAAPLAETPVKPGTPAARILEHPLVKRCGDMPVHDLCTIMCSRVSSREGLVERNAHCTKRGTIT